MIEGGKKLGAELFVLDDGWFGKRDIDDRSLGDWFVNEDKLDLRKAIARCRELNMKFGIWIEPEMINQNSELFRAHPEYAAADFSSYPHLSRHQVPLDFSNPEVVDCVYGMLEKLFTEYKVDYVKWDHNRSVEDCYSPYLRKGRQGEFTYRNVLGYYSLIERLEKRFPDIHFQGCASGGGRFDLGTLYYFPEIWTSDENDPVQRLFIQYGTSFAYPPATMGAHVNDCDVTSYKTKAQIALFGSYGFELDPQKVTDEEAKELEEVNEIYRKYHDKVILDGTFYRLISPFDGDAFAVESVQKDKGAAIVLYVNLLKKQKIRRFIKLKGLDEKALYRNDLDGKTYRGEFYMKVGLNLSFTVKEFQSRLIVLEKV